jgi:hypothetical protein
VFLAALSASCRARQSADAFGGDKGQAEVYDQVCWRMEIVICCVVLAFLDCQG